jgi:hypothetical protein
MGPYRTRDSSGSIIALGGMGPLRSTSIAVVLTLALVACRSMPPNSAPARYIVTTTPIDVGVMSPAICVAIDPTDSKGVWWWLPGSLGCSSRSTGPGVFSAERAVVRASSQTGAIEIRFRVQLILAPGSTKSQFPDVVLVLQDGVMRAMASGAQVPAAPRHDLEVPERPGL